MSRIAPLFAGAVLFTGFGSVNAAPTREARLWEPVEWEFENPGCKANPFDLVAKAGFTHIETGHEIQTELFYSRDNGPFARNAPTRTSMPSEAGSISSPIRVFPASSPTSAQSGEGSEPTRHLCHNM